MSDTDLAELARHRTVFDDETRHVARIYAEALYRAADKQGKVDELLGDLEALVGEVFRRDEGLELFFASASIGRDRKKHVLQSAFETRADPLFVHFLYVLNDHDRLGLVRVVAEAFRALYDRHAGRIRVQVRSAVPLTEAERERLLRDVRAEAGREPILTEAVDPELLGGLVVRVGDWVFDASVRTQLEDIRNQLIERSSHAIQHGRDRFGP
jgi:F-type H+-transporting ATPase subunit delta